MHTSTSGGFLAARNVTVLSSIPESQEDSLEEEVATTPVFLAWKMPWIEEPGGLQSMSREELDTTEQLRMHTSP